MLKYRGVKSWKGECGDGDVDKSCSRWVYMRERYRDSNDCTLFPRV